MADYETIIIGAGRAGIALAVRLIAEGRDDLCILEQGDVPPDTAEQVAAQDLRSFIRIGARAATAAWDARRQHWEVAIEGAQLLTCRCLIAAWGAAAPPLLAGADGAAFAPGDAFALPGFPNLLLSTAPAPVLAALVLLDAPGAIEARAAGPAPEFTLIPPPEVRSIYC